MEEQKIRGVKDCAQNWTEELMLYRSMRVQQKQVKFIIRREKVNDEKNRKDEVKRKGECEGKEWYHFLIAKSREEVNVEEVIVNGQKMNERENIA